MTILIPDSWELPSHLAGDLINMDRFRDRERETVPDEEWTPGQNARVFDINYTRDQKKRKAAPPESSFEPPRSSLGPMLDWSQEIEPYDPAKHGPMEPADLMRQDHADALGDAGFEPQEDSGVWHRQVLDDNGQSLGVTHMIFYNPGHRRPSDNKLVPWHLMTNPDEVGSAHPTLRGAISTADADTAAIKRMSKFAARQSPGQQSADEWLERNSPESFEHDPRQEARDWMDQNADQYEHWNPSPGDYTYVNYGDAAGQSFNGDDSQSHVLPGSAYDADEDSDDDWEQPQQPRERFVDHDLEDDDENWEPDHDGENLANHGFNWEAVDSTAGTSENPFTPETPGKYVKHQIDMEGNHVATHTIEPKGYQPGQWTLHTELSEHGLPVTFPTSIHHGLDDTLDKYKRNSAEAMLPRYGYESARGRANERIWTKSTPHPAGGDREDYYHEISFPEHGFLGTTENISNGALYAPNGSQTHNADDLTDLVREQHRLSQGMHPGGHLDHRLTHSEIMSDPTVSRLGRPELTQEPWGDGKVSRMTWRLPHPESGQLPVNAEANYNWDKGGYDFKYTHDGTPLASSHNAVPAGVPIHIPGRQPPLERS